MSKFHLTIVPATISPVIRDMHRQTKCFDAPNLQAAKTMVKQAFPNGMDLGGYWIVENLTQAAD